jgi:hypothetical protein
MNYDSKKIETPTAKRFRETTKLHVILDIALKDLKKAEKSKKYVIDMGVWHMVERRYDESTNTNIKADKCSICFAGAVMAGTFEVPSDLSVGPVDFENDDLLSRKFIALDHLRGGFIRNAFDTLYGHSKNYPLNYNSWKEYISYNNNKEHFWNEMPKLLNYLKENDI